MKDWQEDKDYQAFRILQFAFVIIPLIAGADKFFGVLTNWSLYLAPQARAILHGYSETFMKVGGAVEIIVGIGVILKPRWFAYILALWLLGIVINLVVGGNHLDIALRDVGLMLGAIALGKLAQKRENCCLPQSQSKRCCR